MKTGTFRVLFVGASATILTALFILIGWNIAIVHCFSGAKTMSFMQAFILAGSINGIRLCSQTFEEVSNEW